jgi:hypothetical protein
MKWAKVLIVYAEERKSKRCVSILKKIGVCTHWNSPLPDSFWQSSRPLSTINTLPANNQQHFSQFFAPNLYFPLLASILASRLACFSLNKTRRAANGAPGKKTSMRLSLYIFRAYIFNLCACELRARERKIAARNFLLRRASERRAGEIINMNLNTQFKYTYT